VNHPGPLPDWWDGDGSVLVFISFGTVAGRLPVGSMVYRAACEAVAGLPVRALLTMGRTRDPAELGDVPANVHVETWVDQQVALGHAGLVVCHGGAGTTFGALAAGVPLVVVPLMADQPTNGRLVYQSGAGLLVETDGAGSPPEAQAGVTAARIRSAIRTVLADPSYATAARRVADEMAAMPALDRVAASLVDWARTGTMQ
jgi:MGT family glycosyltransferase